MNKRNKGKAKRNAQMRAQQIAHKTMPPNSPDTSKTSDAQAISDVTKPIVASFRRPKVKCLIAIVTVLCVAAYTVFSYWSQKATQEQAKEAKHANDRDAGRLAPRAEVVELIPTRQSAEIKSLDKPIHPKLEAFNDRGEPIPAGFVTLDDVHDLCRVNSRVRLRNTGNEIIESVQIHVEELSVMPVGPDGPYFDRDPRDQKKEGLIYKPTLKATQTEDCRFAEKFKPGDEAEVPIARPLIRAILGAHVLHDRGDHAVGQGPLAFGKDALLFPGWAGKYNGAFEVHLYVRAVGAAHPIGHRRGPLL